MTPTAASFHGRAWFDQAAFQSEADLRAASFHGEASFDQISGTIHS